MAKKNKTYTVMIKVMLRTDVEISAETFEEALAKARELKTPDVVQFDGSHNDSEIEVEGVYV
jgi:hypothetical protein